MDGPRFDDMARRLAISGSRRGFVAGLAALTAGILGTDRSEAKQAACPPDQIFRSRVGCICRATGRPPGSAGCPSPLGCRGDDAPCRSDAECCTGNCDSYDRTCQAIPFGCDPVTDPCPTGALCCPNSDSPSGYICIYDTQNNQKACGSTCEDLVNCLNFNPERICVAGVCVDQP